MSLRYWRAVSTGASRSSTALKGRVHTSTTSREARDSTTRYELHSSDRSFTLDTESGEGHVVVRLGDREYKVVLKSVSTDTFEGRVNDKPITVKIEKETGSSITITVNGERLAFDRSVYRPERGGEAQAVTSPKTGDSLLSPMPGRVVTLKVKQGQKVAPGDPLMTIESMKMETLLTCDRDATIAEIRVEEGEAIHRGQTLLVYSK